jgi:hypothetical protein
MARMKPRGEPSPSTAFYKENGKWTFFTYPNGIAEEAGEYSSKELANRAALFAHQLWQANGKSYGPMKTSLRMKP